MILHLLLASLCVAAEPKAAEREFLRGQLLERRGDAAAALRAYESALKADPSSAVINSDAATLALAQGDGRTALEHARRAVALRPADAASLVLLGRVQWSLGDVAAAQKSFEAALRLKPGSAEATYALAGLLADENHPDKALRLLKRFIASHESQAAQARLELAKLELQLDRVKDAERELKASIAASPEGQELPARYALGEAYEVERDTEAALAQYIALSRLEPENAGLL
ncbi:MAG: tetratricopeptide repeat protein, partial [Elusimicrobia bacterium]|nr:tetratricopeptide repeat protein [Elusimicrobiota bacterium]